MNTPRIHEFRGKRVSDQEWVYGDLITKPIHHDCVILENGCINHSVIPETVGYYTGSQSASKKKLFEGDIVSHWNEFILVTWEYAGFNIHHYMQECTFFPEECEIVGNIYDNPEFFKNNLCQNK